MTGGWETRTYICTLKSFWHLATALTEGAKMAPEFVPIDLANRFALFPTSSTHGASGLEQREYVCGKDRDVQFKLLEHAGREPCAHYLRLYLNGR